MLVIYNVSCKEFKVYYKSILLRLSDSTVDIIRDRGMILLLMINKWVEQWGSKNQSKKAIYQIKVSSQHFQFTSWN